MYLSPTSRSKTLLLNQDQGWNGSFYQAVPLVFQDHSQPLKLYDKPGAEWEQYTTWTTSPTEFRSP